MQTATQVESLKRDILRLVGSVSPPSAAPFVVGESPALSGIRSTAGSTGPALGGAVSTSQPRHVHSDYSRHSSAEREATAVIGLGDSPTTMAPQPPPPIVAGSGSSSAGFQRSLGSCASCGAPAGAAASPCPAFSAPTTLNAIKREIAASLRADIRELVREMAAMMAVGQVDHHSLVTSSAAAGLHQLGSPSGLASDLYQTHLYTQL
jgi:hypothetical protein